MKQLLLFLVLFFSISISQACDCDPINIKNAYYGSPIVIEGYVYSKQVVERTNRLLLAGDSVDYTSTSEIVIFEIVQVYKGEIKKKNYIQVEMDISSSCAIHYELGKTYYVFIAHDENIYFTELCMVPGGLDKNSGKELFQLSKE